MSTLARDNWPWELLAFLLGGVITWLLLSRRDPAPVAAPAESVVESQEDEEDEKVLVTAGAPATDDELPQAPPAGSSPPHPSSSRPHADSSQPHAVVSQPQAGSSQLRAVLSPPHGGFSQPMVPADSSPPTVFDASGRAVVPGRYGPGSADAVEHQAPPDGFTIKGNAQSMLFHTPDSPYYGRAKPEVWFRTEPDAERAGFTKYVRRPRRSVRGDQN